MLIGQDGVDYLNVVGGAVLGQRQLGGHRRSCTAAELADNARVTVPAVIPDALSTASRALCPLSGNFRDQYLGVLAYGLSPARRRPPVPAVAIWFRLRYYG